MRKIGSISSLSMLRNHLNSSLKKLTLDTTSGWCFGKRQFSDSFLKFFQLLIYLCFLLVVNFIFTIYSFPDHPLPDPRFKAAQLYVCSIASVMSDSLHPTWIVARQAPLSMGFSRQEYWSGLPCPPPGDLLDPRIKPVSPASPALQADSLPTEPLGSNVLIIILISSTSMFIALPFPLLVLCLSISQIMVILTFFGEVLNMLILQNTLKDSKCL